MSILLIFLIFFKITECIIRPFQGVVTSRNQYSVFIKNAIIPEESENHSPVCDNQQEIAFALESSDIFCLGIFIINSG